jgi:hypothetical protein
MRVLTNVAAMIGAGLSAGYTAFLLWAVGSEVYRCAKQPPPPRR